MTWTLQAIRDHNVADPLGELGPRVERKPEPPPAAPEPVGIITDADGKMRTNLPLPGNTDVPVWPFPTQPPLDTTTEEPGAHGFLHPLKVGDRVRVLKFSPRVCVVAHHVSSWAGDLALRTTDGATLRYIHEGEVWERVA